MALKLSIDIEARFAKALDSFDKLEKQASRSLKRVETAASSVNTALGAIGVGLSLAALGSTLQAAINELGALDDAADQTGASVESLSSLLNTLAPTGVGLDQITDIAGKLVKAMAGASDESSKTGEAFKALGVSTRDAAGNLRGVDDVLVDVAKALSGYEASANKTALAQALLGKSGAEYLPILGDLATRQRAAATVTSDQAAAAETLSNNIRGLSRQFSTLAQDIVVQVAPALNDLFIKLRSIAAISSNPIKLAQYLFGDAADIDLKVTQVEGEISRLNAIIDGTARPDGGAGQRDRPGGTGILGDLIERYAGTEQQQSQARSRVLELVRDLQELKAVQAAQKKLQAEITAPGPGKPQTTAPSLPASTSSSGPKPATVKALQDIEDAAARVDRLVSNAINASDVAAAREYALALERLDFLFFELGLSGEIYDEAVRNISKSTSTVGKDGVGELTKRLEGQASAWKDVIDPSRIYLRQIEEIRALVASGQLSAFEGLSAEFSVQNTWQDAIDGLPDKLDKVTEAAQSMLAPIESAFEAIILQGGSARDVLAGLANDIAALILRQQITGPLFELLGGTFDAKKSGGTIVGGIAKILGFAGGGDPPVGRWSMVGEKGPELIRPLVPMRVYANGTGPAGGGSTIVQNFDLRNSAVSAQIIEAAARRGAALARADRIESGRRGFAEA